MVHARLSASVPPQASKTDQYFLDSAGNVSFFFEEEAFDAGGGLRQAKALSINKIGHGGRLVLRVPGQPSLLCLGLPVYVVYRRCSLRPQHFAAVLGVVVREYLRAGRCSPACPGPGVPGVFALAARGGAGAASPRLQAAGARAVDVHL